MTREELQRIIAGEPYDFSAHQSTPRQAFDVSDYWQQSRLWNECERVRY